MTGTFHHDDRLKISHGNLTKTKVHVSILSCWRKEELASGIWNETRQELIRLDKMLNKFDATSEISTCLMSELFVSGCGLSGVISDISRLPDLS